ncbi:MAG: LamG domain-containing protein, partial [Alphaproteobacteria bacterium]|nr:LamG domain-containing protein [Alphaproteobacteria bacterium]
MMMVLRSFFPHLLPPRHQGGAKRRGTSTKRSANGLRHLKPSPLWGEVFLTTVFCFLLSVFGLPASAHAACLNPAGSAGQVIYNSDHNVLQYCDDTNWISMGDHRSTVTAGENLVGWWKLDESAGTTAYDSSGNNLHATMQGTMSASEWLPTGGAIDGAVNLRNETGAYISAGTASALRLTSEGSWGAWVRFDSFMADSVGHGIVCNARSLLAQPIQNGYCLYQSTVSPWNRLKAVVITTNGVFGKTGDIFLNAGEWYHLFATYDGAELKLYVNGAFDGSNALASGDIIWSGPSPDFSIGGSYAPELTGYLSIDGRVDDVRVYDRALTALEVRQIFKETAGERCPGVAPIAHWRFDEASGTVVRDDAGSNNGTLSNMDPATDRVAGRLGGALDFDGTNDEIIIPDTGFPAGNEPRTLMAWIKSTDWFGHILSYGTEVSYQHSHISVRNSKLRFGTWTDNFDGNTNVDTGNWTHVAASFDSENIALYVNGTLDRSGTLPNTNTVPDGIANIGTRGAADGFEGLIDDVRLYDQALTASQIAAIYNGGTGCADCTNPSGVAGQVIYNESGDILQYCDGAQWIAIGENSLLSGLVGHWTLDETSGTTAFDASGNGNDGTMQGGLDAGNDSVAGQVGTATEFDGTDDYINIGNLPAINGASQVTLAAWMKRTVPGDYLGVGKGTPDDLHGLAITYQPGGIILLAFDNGTDGWADSVQ